MHKPLILLSLILATAISNPAAADADLVSTPVSDHAAIFEKMKSLVGSYQEMTEADKSAKVDYRLISRGTALTETWYMPSGKEELTVFHMDNGILVATHYCASNIQPTMTLASQSTDGIYHFRPRSISNLPSADTAHNSGFGYRFSDDGEIFRNEIWSKSGKETISAMRLERR